MVTLLGPSHADEVPAVNAVFSPTATVLRGALIDLAGGAVLPAHMNEALAGSTHFRVEVQAYPISEADVVRVPESSAGDPQ